MISKARLQNKLTRIGIMPILVTAACILTACPDNIDETTYRSEHTYIKLVNTSQEDIVCIDLIDTIRLQNSHTNSLPNICRADSFLLIPPTQFYCWESYLREDHIARLIVMSAQQYVQYAYAPWDSVRKYVPELHCYQVKLNDLERTNWIIQYPPEP